MVSIVAPLDEARKAAADVTALTRFTPPTTERLMNLAALVATADKSVARVMGSRTAWYRWSAVNGLSRSRRPPSARRPLGRWDVGSVEGCVHVAPAGSKTLQIFLERAGAYT